MLKITLSLILLILLLIAVAPAGQPGQAAPPRAETVSEMWLDISLGPPLVAWFNRVARPTDIARVDHVERLPLLDDVTVGRKLVVFKSAAEAAQMIPTIAAQVDIVGYNLEHGPANPVDEQANPVENARRMRALADEHGLTLAFGPDRRFALSDGPAIAPYVDIFVLQVQRVQTEPGTVYDFVLPMVTALRAANPDLEISIQVRTEGDVVALTDLVDSLRAELDGVSILTSPETTAVAEDLVAELRARREGLMTDAPTLLRRGDVPSTPLRTAASPNVPLSPRFGQTALFQTSTLFWLALVGGTLLVGGIGGGLVAALIFRAKR